MRTLTGSCTRCDMACAISRGFRFVHTTSCCGLPVVCSRTTSTNTASQWLFNSNLRLRPPPFFGPAHRQDPVLLPGPAALAESSSDPSRTTEQYIQFRHAPTCRPRPPHRAGGPFPTTSRTASSFVVPPQGHSICTFDRFSSFGNAVHGTRAHANRDLIALTFLTQRPTTKRSREPVFPSAKAFDDARTAT